jgi:hypothetical protein
MPLVRVPSVGAVGVIKDLSQHELPNNAWTDAKNIRFLDGYAYQFYGHGEVYNSPSFTPQYVMPCNVGGNRYWVYATASKIFCVTITGGVAVHTDITPASARSGVTNKWTGTLLSGVPILNSGDTSNGPMYWSLNPANKFAELPNWPANTYCKSLRSFKNFLIALNVTKSGQNYPFMVKWSHPADPGALPVTWDQTDATKDAGEADLAEGYDPIVDGLQLRNSFMIYKQASCWRMDYIGGPYVFQFSKVLGTSGALNPNCVVEVDGFHVVLTGSDVIVHDGQSAQSVLDKQTRRYLFQNIDVDNPDKCFVFKNPFFNEVFVCYPSIGSSSCNMAMVWNYKDRTVSFREIPNINHAASGPVDNGLIGNWAQDSAPWDSDLTLWNGPDFVPSTARAIMASANTKLYMMDSSASFDGVIPHAYIERRGLSFGAPETIKLVRGIRPRIVGNTGEKVKLRVGWSNDDPYADPTWGPVMEHVIGDTIANDCLVSGRYIAIRFETGTAYQWRLDSYDLDVETGGSW